MNELKNIPETVDGLMNYYESIMTYSDRADVDRQILKSYAEHTIMLRNEVEWCRELPKDIFFPCVAQYRVNNEAIVDVRKMFFDLIYPRIKDKSLKDAILEVNYWCAENGTYHLSDYRTASALTVYKTGLGRCGEESVLAVTALRSVGIAARQVYTPVWAHCDDNHAWVEVWCEGKWQFLGACEPEAILNKGWFTGPASRAMLIHARYFGKEDYPNKTAEDGGVAYIGSTSNYADTRHFKIKVVDKDGKPVSGVTVEPQVLNYGRYANLITTYTDEKGMVEFEVGLGDMRIQVRDEEKSQTVQVPFDQNTLEFVFTGEQKTKDIWEEYQFHAPKEDIAREATVTKEQQEKNAARVEEAKKLREERIHSYYNEKQAAEFPEMEKYFKLARGNFEEIYQFLKKDENPYRQKLIAVLKEKDLYDLKADILEEHFKQALIVQGDYPDDIFVSYVMNPRVEYEELSLYREGIAAWFSEEVKETFRKNPAEVWKYIKNEIKYDRKEDYPVLRISPLGALKTKKANPQSQKILFGAILRTLGIPARLNPIDQEPEFYRDGAFHPVSIKEEKEKSSAFIFEFEKEEDWKYRVTWTINKFENGIYHTLDLEGIGKLEGTREVSVVPGIYQILITTRKPDGDQLVKEFYTEIQKGEKKSIPMVKCKITEGNKASSIKLSSLQVEDQEGKKICLIQEQQEEKKLFIWLGIGEEPTEHVLNELLEETETAAAEKEKIFLLVKDFKDKENTTLKKVIDKIAPCVYRPENFESWHKIAEALGAETARLPLALVIDENGNGIYGTFGYNVGSVHQMMINLKK